MIYLNRSVWNLLFWTVNHIQLATFLGAEFQVPAYELYNQEYFVHNPIYWMRKTEITFFLMMLSAERNLLVLLHEGIVIISSLASGTSWPILHCGLSSCFWSKRLYIYIQQYEYIYIYILISNLFNDELSKWWHHHILILNGCGYVHIYICLTSSLLPLKNTVMQY